MAARCRKKLWQNAEVDALFRLANAGVRVPQPYICTDGVLLMELVVDGSGDVAPRLNDVDMTEARALEMHALLLDQVVRMLCAGHDPRRSVRIQHPAGG